MSDTLRAALDRLRAAGHEPDLGRAWEEIQRALAGLDGEALALALEYAGALVEGWEPAQRRCSARQWPRVAAGHARWWPLAREAEIKRIQPDALNTLAARAAEAPLEGLWLTVYPWGKLYGGQALARSALPQTLRRLRLHAPEGAERGAEDLLLALLEAPWPRLEALELGVGFTLERAGERLPDALPALRSLRLSDPATSTAALALLGRRGPASLEEAWLYGLSQPRAALLALAEAPALPRLRVVALSGNGGYDEREEALWAGLQPPVSAQAALSGRWLRPDALAPAVASGRFEAVTSLSLRFYGLSPTELSASLSLLARPGALPRLEALALDGPLPEGALVALLEALPAGRLRALCLGLSSRGDALGDAGAAALAGCAALSSLALLSLCNHQVGPAGAAALADSPHLASLSTLDLWGNPLGVAGLAALLQGPLAARLSLLSVDLFHQGPGAAAALAGYAPARATRCALRDDPLALDLDRFTCVPRMEQLNQGRWERLNLHTEALREALAWARALRLRALALPHYAWWSPQRLQVLADAALDDLEALSMVGRGLDDAARALILATPWARALKECKI